MNKLKVNQLKLTLIKSIMKKLLALLFIVVISFQGFSQTIYDSTKNFVGENVYEYIGQELWLNQNSESNKKYGFDNFYKNYSNNKYTSRYKPCQLYSCYEELYNKHFIVLDVLKHPNAEDESYYDMYYSYLKLLEIESKDTLYFEYSKTSEYDFPFTVVGFFEKQKKVFINNQYVFSNGTFEGYNDMETGKPLTIKTGQVWKCIDFILESEYNNTYSVVLVNQFGEKVTYDYERVQQWGFTLKQANNYKRKFGEATWNSILKDEVKIGMTKEMCKLMYGEPIEIIKTTTANKKVEQWSYTYIDLYFTNGILTTIKQY